VRRAIAVDDGKTIRVLLARMLAGLGFEVAEAEDGDTALEVIQREGPFELALVDWHMPRLDGLELVRRMRSDPRSACTRILMLTTESTQRSVERALAAGADEFLMKPFTLEMMREKLRLIGALD
jgi:two-component system chemotaxis response regulator CheY